MNIETSEKIAVTLGISPKEVAVYSTLLELEKAKVSALSRIAKIPRTSLYPILEKLAERGFVHRLMVHNHEEWTADDPKDLYRTARASLKQFGALLPVLEKSKGQLSQQAKKTSDVVFYRGRAGIKKAYWDVLRQPIGARVFSIEGNRAVDAKMRRFLSEGREWQGRFRKSGIILESVFGERSLAQFHKLNKDDLSLYTNRLVIGTVLPDETMEFDADIICYGETLAIILVEQDMAIFINNKEIVNTFRHIFRIIQQLGRRVDVNAIAKQLFAQRAR